MINLAIFASGTGTNALNLLEKASIFPHAQICCLIVDTQTSLVEAVNKQYPTCSTYRILPDPKLKGAEKKSEHEHRILEVLARHKISHIFLAGYMRIIGPTLLRAYPGRIINIHPSLLPLYPGVDSYRRAFEDCVSEGGVTVHIVDEGVDTGPVLLQKRFPRLETDTLEDFVNRGKSIEWDIYPQVLALLGE